MEMKKLLLTLLLSAIIACGFGQQHSDNSSTTLSYQITFDRSDVKDWSEFESFVINITAASEIEVNKDNGFATIYTSRELDPKVINGKFEKFGVDFIELIKQ